MQNLRDKLLKAGLVSQAEAQKAEHEGKASKPRPETRPPESKARDARSPPSRPAAASRPGASRPPDTRRPGPAESRIPRLPPLAVPGTKAHQRLEALKQQERDKNLRDLVYGAQVPVEGGGHAFHFVTRKGKLRRLELSEAQAKLLEEGKLAVVERQEPACIEHSLVPPETAEKMMGIWEKSVRFFNKGGTPIGFLSDDELKAREAAEARGEAFAGGEPANDEGVTDATSSDAAEVTSEAAPVVSSGTD